MKTTLNWLLCLLLPVILLTGCKKDAEETITYTETVVPLYMMGYSSVPSAVQEQYFVRQLPAAGGKPPYTWRFVSGTMPPGLSLLSNGRVTGTPSATGEYTYTLELKDSKGTTVQKSYTQKVGASGSVGFLLLQPEIPAFGQNHDVGYQFFAQGGTLPWTFSISGLPAGVSYDPATGVISGLSPTASTGAITIELHDALGNAAANSPATAYFSVKAPVPSGGGGTTGNCTSPYNGTYIGEFKYVYYVKGQDGNYSPVEAGLQLTLKWKCLATAAGSTVMTITKAVCSDANFNCQVGGCVPVTPSVATLPANLPVNPSNPSTAGQGIVIFFPNGTQIMTTNGAGAMYVTTDGRTISNSLSPEFQDNTWLATGGNFPSGSVPPGGPVTKFKSWTLTWSATD
jgi:hypothetical protein